MKQSTVSLRKSIKLIKLQPGWSGKTEEKKKLPIAGRKKGHLSTDIKKVIKEYYK